MKTYYVVNNQTNHVEFKDTNLEDVLDKVFALHVMTPHTYSVHYTDPDGRVHVMDIRV
jgi:hypothetical protein